MIDAEQAMVFLLLWLSAVFVHGILRSAGEARQDPIVPSGPVGVFDTEEE
jgi:hypothetical protein